MYTSTFDKFYTSEHTFLLRSRDYEELIIFFPMADCVGAHVKLPLTKSVIV